MAAPIGKNTVDTEVHITYEDQKKINKFARFNARLHDFKDELEEKKKEKQNLEDAGDELLMLDDDTEPIPYQVGEVFVHSSVEDTNGMLEKAKERLDTEIAGLEGKCEAHKEVLSQLKVQLYAKFGTNINLEADDE